MWGLRGCRPPAPWLGVKLFLVMQLLQAPHAPRRSRGNDLVPCARGKPFSSHPPGTSSCRAAPAQTEAHPRGRAAAKGQGGWWQGVAAYLPTVPRGNAGLAARPCAPVLWAVPPRCALPACRTHAVNVVGSASACWPRRRHIGAGLRLAPPPLPDRILRSAHPCHRRCLEPGAGAVFSLAAILPLWTLPPTTAAVRLCFAPPPALPPRCHVFDTFHCSWDGHGGRASPQQRARQPSTATRRRRHTWRGRRRHRDYPAAPSPLLATPREPPPNRLA